MCVSCGEELRGLGVHLVLGPLECDDAEDDEAGDDADFEDDPERRPDCIENKSGQLSQESIDTNRELESLGTALTTGSRRSRWPCGSTCRPQYPLRASDEHPYRLCLQIGRTYDVERTVMECHE